MELDALLCGDATYRTIYIEYNTFQKYDLFMLNLFSGDFKGSPTPIPIPLVHLCLDAWVGVGGSVGIRSWVSIWRFMEKGG